jgi:CheY-like chemotaxis protein
MTEKITKKMNVLMIEDNPADAFLTREILADSERISYAVSTVTTAADALAFLYGMNGYENSTQPDLILLDLNLPKMHGFEFLTEIRRDKNLTDLQVVVLTTSEVGRDMERAKELGVKGYIIKPIDLDEFESVVLTR